MKKQKTQSKIIVALTAVVILLVAVSATLTFAYFTASKSAQSSQMTFGTLGLNINETLAAQTTCTHANGNSSITNLIPGCSIKVGDTDNIVVTGNIDALVRAKLTATVWQAKRLAVAADVPARAAAVGDIIDVTSADSGMTGYDEVNSVPYIKTTATAAANATLADTIFTLINAQISGWTFNSGDNYYYLNSIANNSSFTFSGTITLGAADFSNIWQGALMKLNLVVDAIQAEHLNNNAQPTAQAIEVIKANEGNAISDVTVNGSTVKLGGATDAQLMAAAIASATAWTVNMQTGVAG